MTEKIAEGNLEKSLRSLGSDEVGDYKSVDHMAGQIKTLLSQLLKAGSKMK